jgi:nucleoside-diphosphate-sugar epimerase
MNTAPGEILLTGATGFVGQALDARLRRDGHRVLGTARQSGQLASGTPVVAAELRPEQDWSSCLTQKRTVVHLAARVHVMDERAADPLAAFRLANTAGTLNLARQSAAAGVRRFVFVSSVKVNGEQTPPGRAFRFDDAPAPIDPYGVSKREAEDGLRELGESSGMEVVIVRPPLVYGPGVKANFAALMRAVRGGWPLPLGGVTANRRSLVALDNLVDLLARCIDHPAAAGQTFLASDGEDLSTAELLRRMGQAMGRPARLVPVPASLLGAGAALLGRRAVAQRLLGSLQVDIAHTRHTLGWTPPVSVNEGLRRAATGLAA